MIEKIFLPKLGETMEEATIERWVKKEGDEVKRGEVLLEITTDKATLEVESYATGTLRKILVPEGSTAPVNAVIALVGPAEEPIPEELLKGAGVKEEAPAGESAKGPLAQAPQPAAEPAEEDLGARKKVSISPRARKLAEAHGIDWKGISGSGPGGRIVESDVRAYIEKVKGLKATPLARKVASIEGVDIAKVSGSGPGGKITRDDVVAAAKALAVPTELTAMRRLIAERMSLSKREIPHYYLSMDFNMEEAAAFRAKWNAKKQTKISYNDIIIRASALAIKDFPVMNSFWKEGSIVRRQGINIGLAVALPEGLIVPVVKNADRKSLEEIARETASLVQKARNKRLTPDQHEGGSFTVTNLGMYEVSGFAAIINPGESAILALGQIADAVVADAGAIRIQKRMTATLSLDHRVIDGAVGAAFLRAVKEYVENVNRL